MTKRIVSLFLVSGVLAAAQSTLGTQTTDPLQNPTDMQQSSPDLDRIPLQTGPTVPGRMVPDLSRYGTDMQQSNQGLQQRSPNNVPRFVGPLRTKSEFQQYAEDATGRQLLVYGRQLFDQVPSTFAPLENIPVPADYVLGPGDQLLVRVWGKVEMNTRVLIDRNGQISLPRVGTLTVAGLHYSQLDSFLRSAIGAMYKDFELNVSLGQLRTIQIYVLGNARQPGAYTVGSLSTLMDALFACGGPSATGTMRDIQLRRDGKTISDFDLYDLIAHGDKSKDEKLLPGDIIFIPAIGPQVAISGDVNQPGIFELKGSTTAGAAIAIAGGMTSLASSERAVLERTQNHANRSVEEFSLDEAGRAHELKDGDLLRVFPLSPKFANAVTLRGNVAVPGLYPWKEGMRISDLIPSRDALITREYWNRQNHLVQPIARRPFAGVRIDPTTGEPVRMPDNYQQNQADDIRIDAYGNRVDAYGNRVDAYGNRVDAYGNRVDAYGNPVDANGNPLGANANAVDAYGNPRRTGSGAQVQRNDAQGYPNQPPAANQSTGGPGDQSRTEQTDQGVMETSPLVNSIGKNSAEINWEYALIERLDERDLSTHLIPFRLASAIDVPSSADNQVLKPGDVVTIFSRADLDLPMEKHASFVRIGGEVNAPGVYRVDPGETLEDLVKKAGGLTKHSYLYASVFTRESARKAQEAELRQSTEQMQRELVAKFANTVPQPGQTAADQQSLLAMQQDSLARLASIRPTGRVVLALKPDAQSITDIPAFPLEDGDSFYIPPRLSTVQVAGSVYNANAFRYEPSQRLSRYLDSAGGPTREADTRRIFVIRADGTVVSRQSRNTHAHGNFVNLRMLPGDAIVVPQKLRTSSKTAEFVQYTQLASQLALTAAALNVIR